MSGFFKRLKEIVASTDRYPQELDRSRLNACEPDEPPSFEAVIEEGDGEISPHGEGDATRPVLDLEIFRQGPIGVWRGSLEEPSEGYEVITFAPAKQGVTRVYSPDGVLEEECIFEWQTIAEHYIRMRYVAWVTVGEEGFPEHDEEESDSEASEAEAEEPEQGEWETIEYYVDYVGSENAALTVLVRSGEEGFTCSCRYGHDALVFEPEGLRGILEAHFQTVTRHEEPAESSAVGD